MKWYYVKDSLGNVLRGFPTYKQAYTFKKVSIILVLILIVMEDTL